MCWPARIWRKVVRAIEEGEITDQNWGSPGLLELERVYERFGKSGGFASRVIVEGCCLKKVPSRMSMTGLVDVCR
jgi:hypothetical protein